MSDDEFRNVRVTILLGHHEIHNLAPRIEGNDLIPRTRFTTFDGDGNITKDEIVEGPLRLVNGAQFANLWQSLSTGGEPASGSLSSLQTGGNPEK